MAVERLPRRYCQFDGWRVAYAVRGAGPPILLLHGLSGSADYWQPAVQRLAPHATVIVPDLLGFGYSDKPPVEYTLEQHIGALAAVVRAAGAPHLRAVVGHSCGGVIAMAALGTVAVAADRLCLAATPFASPRFPLRRELLTRPLDRLMLSWAPMAMAVHGALMLLWPLLRRAPVPSELRGAWAGFMDHTIHCYRLTAKHCLFQANIDPLLPAVRSLPTLLLYASHDRTVPFIHGVRFHRALPQSWLVAISGGHHAILRAGLVPLTRWLAPDALAAADSGGMPGSGDR